MDEEKKIRNFKVAYVKDLYTLILNCGSDDSIQEGQRFLIYSIGEEIYDPDTKQSLGKLEIVKGTGRVTHVQKKLSTIYSDMKVPAGRTIRKMGKPGLMSGIMSIYGSTETEEYLPPEAKPFEDPIDGDYAKRI